MEIVFVLDLLMVILRMLMGMGQGWFGIPGAYSVEL